jgi:hypothetical protein
MSPVTKSGRLRNVLRVVDASITGSLGSLTIGPGPGVGVTATDGESVALAGAAGGGAGAWVCTFVPGCCAIAADDQVTKAAAMNA